MIKKNLIITLLSALLLNLFFVSGLHAIHREQKWCYNDKVELWSEAFGDSHNPPMLLIMGAMNQGILWPDSLCEKLALEGYFVIRYDHRDVGQSSSFNFVREPYDLKALKEDAVLILDHYNIQAAHIVGVSMGGIIGELMAIEDSNRVESLTLIMSTHDLSTFFKSMTGKKHSVDASLPPPSDQFLKYLKKKMKTKGGSEEEKINLVLEGWKICNGDHLSFPTEDMYALQKKVRHRARNLKAAFNHIFALFISDLQFDKHLKDVSIPTLVIHGRQDPCLPVEHGESLSKLIENSQLEVVEEMGHFLVPELSEKISHLICHHVDQYKKSP
ncbi:MAG: alpha/beta fold hydrolase [Chlamydiales bacterium]|nr:alpha/beta fold hydrolase [Chlamydiales bacterium]